MLFYFFFSNLPNKFSYVKHRTSFFKISKIFPCLSYVNFNSLSWPEPDLGHHDLNKFASTLRKRCFNTRFSFSGELDLEKTFNGCKPFNNSKLYPHDRKHSNELV